MSPLDTAPARAAMHVELATATGIPSAALDDPDLARTAIARGCEAGCFTVLDVVVRRFEPHGVTATAVVGESHLTLHTWPEHGAVFVDVASCSTPEAARRGVDAILGTYAGRPVHRRAETIALI